MTSRMQELELEVYDGCIAPIWEVKSFVPSNTIEVYQTGSEVYYPKVDHTNCFTDPTSLCYCYSDLSLPCHRTYQAPGKGSDCGQEQFIFSLPDWVVSKTEDPEVKPTSNGLGYDILLESESNDDLGYHKITVKTELPAIASYKAVYGYPDFIDKPTDEITVLVLPCKVQSINTASLDNFVINADGIKVWKPFYDI